MGVYVLQADQVFTNVGGWYGELNHSCPLNVPTGGGSDSEILAGINSANSLLNKLLGGRTCGTPDTVGSEVHIRFGYGLSTNNISLDGNPAISFDNLVPGFKISSAQLQITVSLQATFAPTTANLERGQLDTKDIKANLSPYTSIFATVSDDWDYSNPTLGPTIFQVIQDGFGLDFVPSVTGDTPFFVKAFNAFVIGLYDIVADGFSLDTIGPATNGDTISVSATSGLDTINKVQIQYNDGTTVTIDVTSFVTQTPTSLTFILPFLGFTGTAQLFMQGTSFSGSVLLGSLEVLVENGSGIYEIVPGKTNDTIYVNSGDGPTTQDVKIPNPRWKTGYIGG
jgi:hypothetical protein